MQDYSYFTPTGQYRGTWRKIEVADVPGATLHADGVSLVRPDGSVLKQMNPYTTKERYTKLNLTSVSGEFSGTQRLRDGVVADIPDADRPVSPPTVEDLLHRLVARVVELEARSGPTVA